MHHSPVDSQWHLARKEGGRVTHKLISDNLWPFSMTHTEEEEEGVHFNDHFAASALRSSFDRWRIKSSSTSSPLAQPTVIDRMVTSYQVSSGGHLNICHCSSSSTSQQQCKGKADNNNNNVRRQRFELKTN